MSEQPYEIIAAPFEVWIAPIGEAFPLIDATPAGNWVKIGTAGKRNMHEDGVTVGHPQTIEEVYTLGSVGPVKAFRTQEGLVLSFTLLDLTLEEYSRVLNTNTVSDDAASSGVAGFRTLPLSRGLDVAQRAALIKGAGPYGTDWDMQYQLPYTYMGGEPEVVFTKGEPAGLLHELHALEDPAAASEDLRFGRLIAMDAAAT